MDLLGLPGQVLPQAVEVIVCDGLWVESLQQVQLAIAGSQILVLDD